MDAGHVGPPLPCNYVKLVDVAEMNYLAANGEGEVSRWFRLSAQLTPKNAGIFFISSLFFLSLRLWNCNIVTQVALAACIVAPSSGLKSQLFFFMMSKKMFH